MSLKFRRFLYIIFILIFLIASPALILYAAGYRLGSGFNIEKTGVLILATQPKGAKIFLNDKLERPFWGKFIGRNKNYILTPAKINYLRPGEYNVKLEINGYWPWEKKLQIKTGQTTFAEDVFLFKKSIPIALYGGEINNIAGAPNKKYFVSVNNEEIVKISADSISTENYFFNKKRQFANKNIIFSPDSNKVLIDNLLFNQDNWLKPLRLADISPATGTIWHWHNLDADTLFYSQNNKIFSYNINKKSVSILDQEKQIDDFLPHDDYLFLLIKRENNSALIVKDRVNGKQIRRINLPLSNYIFKETYRDFLIIFDKKHSIFYFLDPFSDLKPLIETVANANKIIGIDKNKMVLANDFEIWLLNLKSSFDSQKKTLLTRVSSPINSIFWHPSNNYIIYSTANNINTIELDDRDRHNITSLVSLNEISHVFLDANGKNLFFQASIGSKRNFYKISIQ